MPSDLDTLIEFGFEREKAELAIKQTGGLQEAIDWLDKNSEKTVAQLKEEQASAVEEPPALKPGEEAKSLQCDDCGKQFRSVAQAEFHASKSGHENFSESTEEIKPLTEEEKAQKLELMKQRLAEKRAAQAEQEKIDRKKNEQIRLKATKESQDIKEELQKKERIKEAQAKKREKQEEADARKRVLAKLEADKQERKLKAEQEKAKRAGTAVPEKKEVAGSTSSGPTTSKPASAYTEARLALQTPTGRVMKTFPVETTLFEVAHALQQDGIEVETFTQNFPRKVFDKTDFGMTLKEAGMVPSAALVVK
ncbi:ubiquitin-related domain-containing protein [Clohesyomyces aquaticus]|uniref:Ubiquitin-related domain-containing protein n=1 Tax=Clohesyomyces aquaticus TaxID=1231657 RepID=A0A1Y1ZGL6_9PLEO|nr:ubiquitin-related domain-containing protein [Clohesyomyces aquaticus]